MSALYRGTEGMKCLMSYTIKHPLDVWCTHTSVTSVKGTDFSNDNLYVIITFFMLSHTAIQQQLDLTLFLDNYFFNSPPAVHK